MKEVFVNYAGNSAAVDFNPLQMCVSDTLI